MTFSANHTIFLRRLAMAVLWTWLQTPAAIAGPTAEPFFLWIEAERFTTATQGIRIVNSDHALMTPDQERSGTSFLERSGWSVEASRKVSGEGYIEQTAGGRMAPESGEYVSYSFRVPVEDDYRIWIRCHSPPPCARYFNIWLDVPRPGEARRKLNFSFFNVWSWWPWGEGDFNTGKAMPIRLGAGPHVLHIGNIGQALKIDKLLISNDESYMPHGANQDYYTGTFEPEQIADVHDWRLSNARMEARATGWEALPKDRWEIREEPLRGNHYFYATPVAPGDPNPDLPARALIKDLERAYFEARLSILRPDDQPVPNWDAALVFGLVDSGNYWAIRFAVNRAALERVDRGVATRLRSVSLSIPRSSAPHPIVVRRSRDRIVVWALGQILLNERLAATPSGRIGLESATGGVGFDDVTIRSLDDPCAQFDFTARDDPALADWVVSEKRSFAAENPGAFPGPGEIVVYRVPFWSDSAMKIELESRQNGPFSVLYPFVDERNCIQTRVKRGEEASLEIIRHRHGRALSRGTVPLKTMEDSPGTLTLQSVKGLFGIFAGRRRLFEMNEYELLEGTVAIAMDETSGGVPIRHLSIESREMIHDDFPLSDSGALRPEWRVAGGRWMVGMGLEGQAADGDGQLIARGPGTVLIGNDQWREVVMQVSACFDRDTALALVGWARGNEAVELHCADGKIRLRKIVDRIPVTLAEERVEELAGGWHRLGLDLREHRVEAEVDGVGRLSIQMRGLKGAVGLRNEADLAVFDNLLVQVLSKDAEAIPSVRPVDPTVIEIQESFAR